MRKFKELMKQISRSVSPRRMGVVRIVPLSNGAEVFLTNGRNQMIRVIRDKENYFMESVVLGRTHVEALGHTRVLPLTWFLNRETSAVTFHLDRKGRLVGTVKQRADSLDPVELIFYLEALANEVDRLRSILVKKRV